MTRAPARPRLRRSNCSKPGIARVRRGRGFAYQGPDGARVSDPQTLERVRALTIPPAWRKVWICADPRGHLQATGLDAAGRTQYLYHPRWRELREAQKFRDMEDFGAALPHLRTRARAALRGGGKLDREQVAAGAVRLLDIGLFRIGGERYAEDSGHLGIATMTLEHVRLEDGAAVFDYPAKSGVHRVQQISDRLCVALVARLRRRRSGPPELLAYRASRSWHALGSDAINQYIKAALGERFSAKDFRTWNATVLAAALLAARARLTGRARAGAVRAALGATADALGNTPAVARRSYVDPRVIDRYLAGETITAMLPRADGREALSDRKRRQLELAVLELLAGTPARKRERS